MQHNFLIATWVAGAALIGAAIYVRSRYGPINVFGQYTHRAIYIMMLLLAGWNLFWWRRHAEMWSIALAVFLAAMAIYGLATDQKRRAKEAP